MLPFGGYRKFSGSLTLENYFNAACPICREKFELNEVSRKRKRDQVDNDQDCAICCKKMAVLDPGQLQKCKHDVEICMKCYRTIWTKSKRQRCIAHHFLPQ